jgi:hypothetical protein
VVNLDDAVRVTMDSGVTFDKAQVFIHATKEIDPDTGQEGAVRIQLYGDAFMEIEIGFDVSEEERRTGGWAYSGPFGPLSEFMRCRTAYRLLNKNSVPEVTGLLKEPWKPYQNLIAEASRYRASGSLQLSFDEKSFDSAEGSIRTNVTVTAQLRNILSSGRPFRLAFCDRSRSTDACDLWRLADPFFYQDNEHSFFVSPSFNPEPDDEIRGFVSDLEDRIEVLLTEAEEETGVVRVPPGGDPAPVVISPEAVHVTRAPLDWLVDPTTLFAFGGQWIAGHGAIGPVERSGGVEGNVGIALSETGAADTTGGLNLVTSRGLDPAALASLRARRMKVLSGSRPNLGGRLPD